MDADRSESRESSRHLDGYSFVEKASRRHYWLPERPLFQNESPVRAGTRYSIVERSDPRPSRKFPRPSAFLLAIWFSALARLSALVSASQAIKCVPKLPPTIRERSRIAVRSQEAPSAPRP